MDAGWFLQTLRSGLLLIPSIYLPGRQMPASPLRCQGETWLSRGVHGTAQASSGDSEPWGRHSSRGWTTREGEGTEGRGDS